jgi:hypothetical protein
MYGGSSVYGSSYCNSVSTIVNAAASVLTLSSSNSTVAYLTPVTFTAHLTTNGRSAGAGNAIHLGINGQNIALTTDASGTATYTISTLHPNSYPVVASFAATSNLLASSASLTEVITTALSSVNLTAVPNPGSLNQPVTLTATVSSPPTSTLVGGGSVTFYDGSTPLGTAQLTTTGTASIAPSFSTVGDYSLTAAYSGTSDFTGSTSAVLDEKITLGDFTFSVTPGTANVYTGEAATVQVSAVSLLGFNQPLTLSCSGLPANTTCSFSPASLPQGQGLAHLVIQTAAPHKTGAGYISGPVALLGALTLLLLPGRKRRRGFLTGLSLLLLVAAIGMGLAGCGSPAPITDGTPPGTYQIAVTATTTGSGTVLTHSSTVTLTVKSLF